jgi:Flp pilus assembly protein TadD
MVSLAAALSACQSLDLSAFGNQPDGYGELPEAEFYASDEALAHGKEYFRQGDYGKAEASYRRAVELMPNDPEALLGLAASYDRLRRFDLADRIYEQIAPYVSARPEYYNNLGYSYILRGDLRTGRTYLLKAYELDPKNPVIVNNLTMLKNSVDYPIR